MSSAEKPLYQTKIAGLSDTSLVEETERVCWFSAFANNNPRAPAHWQADMLMDEAMRREKPWLYAQGRNNAIRSCGYEPTENDLEAARPKSSETSP